MKSIVLKPTGFTWQCPECTHSQNEEGLKLNVQCDVCGETFKTMLGQLELPPKGELPFGGF